MSNFPRMPKIEIKLCSLTPCTPGFHTRCRPVHFTTTNEGHWIQEMFGRRPSHLRIFPSAPAYERSVRKEVSIRKKMKLTEMNFNQFLFFFDLFSRLSSKSFFYYLSKFRTILIFELLSVPNLNDFDSW
jgi:hypothetical protein